MSVDYKYLYGPVSSWRLGISLGIDPLSLKEKICNYDCVYCQLGPTSHLTAAREIYVPTESILEEIRAFTRIPLDYLTFSGRGEPTLAANLGEMIRALKKERKEKIAVITNSSLLHFPDVQDDLAEADFVVAKIDSATKHVFEQVNKSYGIVDFHEMVEGIRSFRRIFRGKMALQMMFVAENISEAPGMAQLARTINADEIEINTPTRVCASQCLNELEIDCIKSHFEGLPVLTVYDRSKKAVEPLDPRQTIRRHGRDLPTS